jgi:hypothetical protein
MANCSVVTVTEPCTNSPSVDEATSRCPGRAGESGGTAQPDTDRGVDASIGGSVNVSLGSRPGEVADRQSIVKDVALDTEGSEAFGAGCVDLPDLLAR